MKISIRFYRQPKEWQNYWFKYSKVSGPTTSHRVLALANLFQVSILIHNEKAYKIKAP